MVVVVRNLVEEEARTPEVGEVHSPEAGEVHSPEAGIVVVVDSHVAAPGRGRRTCRCAMRGAAVWPRVTKPSLEARVRGVRIKRKRKLGDWRHWKEKRRTVGKRDLIALKYIV